MSAALDVLITLRLETSARWYDAAEDWQHDDARQVLAAETFSSF